MAGKMLAYFRREKEESWNMRNGRILLEESISLFDGKVNPIPCFSARELEIATNNFSQDNVLFFSQDNLLFKEPFIEVFTLYRGFLRDEEIIVKKHRRIFESSEEHIYAINDIVIASRLSVHKNVLKLIGCCLETELPMAVYESFNCDGILKDELLRDYQRPSLAWKHRLKVAVDLSNLVAYLHTALPRPLIHRDLKIDMENCVVKMFNFGHCTALPKGESFVKDEHIQGSIGYIDPEYLNSSQFNEKVDVYSFGVMLLVLLSGKKPIQIPISEGLPATLVRYANDCAQKNDIFEFIDPRLSADEPWLNGQFKALFILALECIRDRGEDRPDMTQVGTKLAEMYRASFSGS